MKTLLIITLACILVAGCSTVETESTLHSAAASAACDTLGMVYYKGRKKGYDYFRVQWNIGSKTYRLPVPNTVTEKPMPYTSKRDKWIVCGPHSLTSWTPLNSTNWTPGIIWMSSSETSSALGELINYTSYVTLPPSSETNWIPTFEYKIAEPIK